MRAGVRLGASGDLTRGFDGRDHLGMILDKSSLQSSRSKITNVTVGLSDSQGDPGVLRHAGGWLHGRNMLGPSR